MDRNETIVDEVEKLIAEEVGDPTLAKLRKTEYVKGYQYAFKKVQELIDLIKKLTGSSNS